jgi:hypothetical protein
VPAILNGIKEGASIDLLERKVDREIRRFTPYRKVREMLEQRFRLATGSERLPAVPAETAQPRLQLGRKRREASSRQRRAK